MSVRANFPTFCHITQYGDGGYADLAQMLAISKPLNLWAPSSVLLSAPSSPLPAKKFLKLVDKGHIRVFGREGWITRPDRAANVGWQGAGWTPDVDGTLLRWATADADLPDEEKRVVVAPPEGGAAFAARYFDEHHEEIGRWAARLADPYSRRRIPDGTLSAARRAPDDAAAAHRVIRDAYNHGEAFGTTGASGWFVLSRSSREFMKILQESPATTHAGSTAVKRRAQAVEDLGEQMLELIEALSSFRGKRHDPFDFVGTEAHRQLAAWTARFQADLLATGGRVRRGTVFEKLILELENVEFRRGLRSVLPPSRTEAAIGTASFATDILSAVTSDLTHPASLTGGVAVAGVAATTVVVARGLLRELNLAARQFEAPHWPFYYTFRREGSARQRDQLVSYLRDQLRRVQGT